jgi:hypothetical protein
VLCGRSGRNDTLDVDYRARMHAHSHVDTFVWEDRWRRLARCSNPAIPGARRAHVTVCGWLVEREHEHEQCVQRRGIIKGKGTRDEPRIQPLECSGHAVRHHHICALDYHAVITNGKAEGIVHALLGSIVEPDASTVRLNVSTRRVLPSLPRRDDARTVACVAAADLPPLRVVTKGSHCEQLQRKERDERPLPHGDVCGALLLDGTCTIDGGTTMQHS